MKKEIHTAGRLAQLKRRIGELKQNSTVQPLRRIHRDSDAAIPVSPAQRRMWFVEQLYKGSSSYNEWQVFRLTGKLDKDALTKSLCLIVDRHEIFRTVFQMGIDGQPVQKVNPEGYNPLTECDMSDLSDEIRLDQALEYIHSFVSVPFDLSKGPLLRCLLVTLNADNTILVFNSHHIAVDATSWRIVMEELATIYESLIAGADVSLEPVPFQYADFAFWQLESQRDEVINSQLEYWKARLEDAPDVLSLPTDRPRPPVQSTQGNRLLVPLPDDLVAWVHEFARKSNATAYMVLLTAFSVVLSRYSGEKDMVIGTPVAGRSRPELQQVVGCFVNSVPLRIKLTGTPSFSELLAAVKETTLEAFEHQEVPLEKIIDALQIERNSSHQPLFQVVFSVQQDNTKSIDFGGLRVEPLQIVVDRARFDLTLAGWISVDAITLVAQYQTDLFEESSIRRMLKHLEQVLREVAADPERSVFTIGLLTEEEKQFMDKVNATEKSIPKTVYPRLFEERLQKWPDAIAVECGSTRWSYRELNDRAEGVAHLLLSRGISKGSLVGVILDRSPMMVAVLLGIWKAGAAFVPMDHEFPVERVKWILSDSKAALLITEYGLRDQVPDGTLVLFIEEIPDNVPQQPVSVAVEPDDLAYVIYTSGSTGVPKGVLVDHVGLPNLAAQQAESFDIQVGDRYLMVISLAFDVSVAILNLVFLNGATMVLASKFDTMPGEPVARVINDLRITHIHQPPSALAQLPVREYPTLRVVLVGGEECPLPLARKWAARLRLFNMYGPTERTSLTSFAELSPDEPYRSPIGRPLFNTKVYVLDEWMQPVPIGVPGELYIGGVGIARGYLGKPGLTAERFVPNPFAGKPGERLYKTGDRVRLRADGQLEFLGRFDFQVKVRGYRIEIGEIETVMSEHPDIKQCAVVTHKDESGVTRLVTYFVSERVNCVEDVVEFARKRLLNYMIPSIFVPMEKLPLNTNGKVDRRALPEPLANQERVRPMTAPRTPMEATLLRIICDVLGREDIDVFDNFFRIGGDSISSVRVATLARERGIDLDTPDLFMHQTVAELAAAARPSLEQQNEQKQRLANVDDVSQVVLSRDPKASVEFRLSSYQEFGLQRILQNYDPAVYVVISSYRTKGIVWDHEAFKAAWNALAQHHTAMRACMAWEGLAEPRQVIYESVDVPIDFKDWRHLETSEAEERVARFTSEEKAKGIDLSKAPCMRVTLIRMRDDQYAFIWTRHHLLFDGWSRSLVLNDFFKAYEAALAGIAIELGETDIRLLMDWVEDQNANEGLAFWSDYLNEYQPVFLDREIPHEVPAGTTQRIFEYLNEDEKIALEQIVREKNVTLYECLRMAFGIAVSLHLGTSDLVIGEIDSGRTIGPLGIESTVGNTLRLLPSRFKFGTDRWYDWIQSNRPQQLRCQQNGFLRLKTIAETVSISFDLFDSYLVYEHFPTSDVVNKYTNDWENIGSVPPPKTTIPYRFEILNTNQLVLSCVYYETPARAEIAKSVLTLWGLVLRSIITNQDISISELKLCLVEQINTV